MSRVRIPTVAISLAAAPPRPWWRHLLRAVARRLRERWPTVRRTLPRDLAILLLVYLVSRLVGVAWVMTDSVHTSMALVLKTEPPARGDLAAFAYAGGTLPNYYLGTPFTRGLMALGFKPQLDGPQPGDGFMKYLSGLPGDRIVVEGRQVFLVTPSGRYAMGEAKTHTRHGVPLQPIQAQTIPPGFVYVWAPHRDALDSRYAVMGLVPVSSLAGKGVALW
jgi:conjugal transfer pilin signal peptidase TrbI